MKRNDYNDYNDYNDEDDENDYDDQQAPIYSDAPIMLPIGDQDFILAGNTFIDSNRIAAFSFVPSQLKNGFLSCVFHLVGGMSIKAEFANRNEVAQLFMELEDHFNNPALTVTFNDILKKVDAYANSTADTNKQPSKTKGQHKKTGKKQDKKHGPNDDSKNMENK